MRWQPPKEWGCRGGLVERLRSAAVRAKSVVEHVARALAHFHACDAVIATAELSNYIGRCESGRCHGPSYSKRDKSKTLKRHIAAAVPVAMQLREHGRQLLLSLRETAAEPDAAPPTEAEQRAAAEAREQTVRRLQQHRGRPSPVKPSIP